MRRLLPLLLPVLLISACTTRAPAPVATAPAECPKAVIIPSTPVSVSAQAVCPAVPATPAKPEPVSARYLKADWSALPDWPGADLAASFAAWRQSCTRIGQRNGWAALCDASALIPAQDLAAQQAFFEQHFQPWQMGSSSGDTEGLITGYYEPLLTGGRAPKKGRVPLHAVPADMLTIDLAGLYPELKGMRLRGRLDGNKVVPYYDRRDIDAGRAPLADRVLVWADDPVDAFFLQVQGSGRVQLDDGSLMRVGYADQNGHPYRSIGRWLADQGELPLEQVSMQRIKAWAQANPARLPELLAANPSYVFFRELPAGDGGPIGALNVPLTDGASIAIDPKFIPLGAPVYLATTRPDTGEALHRLVQAQDTGGAIRGPVRADYFWGFGHAAGEAAGKTKQRGRLWLLWPRGMALPEGR